MTDAGTLDLTTSPRAPRFTRHLYRYTFQRHAIGEAPRDTLDQPERAYESLWPLFDGHERETLMVALLDRKQHIVGIEEVYRGTHYGMSVRMADLFTAAVRLGAVGILLAHNHPSGDPEPSGDDIRTTRDAVTAGRMLGIAVVDHVIIGGERRYVSLRERGIVS